MADYKELIEGCFDDFMASGEFEEIIRSHVAKCMEEAIRDSFRWGDMRKAVKAKVNSVLVPYIERYSMDAYTVKLDMLLSDIAEHTSLADNKRILENFGGLMTEPDKETVSLEEVFGEYKRFVAKTATGAGLEVEEGTYGEIMVFCEIVERNTRGIGYRWEEVVVRFAADVPDEEERDDLAFEVVLHSGLLREQDAFLVFPPVKPTIDGLVRMGDFEVFIARLNRARVGITGIRDMSGWIEIEAEPECVWQ